MKTRALWLSVSALTLVCCGAAGAQTTSTAKKDEADSGKVQEVVITADVVDGKARPLYTYSDKVEAQKSAS